MAVAQFSYEPFGAARDVFYERASEVLISGPAGTGKSRGCLEKLHLAALKYPGMRGLICRKTRSSLTQSAIVTFESQVMPPLRLTLRSLEQEYRYPNGSVVVLGGLDREGERIMSTDYDLVYVQEATELAEAEWDKLTTRLRNGVLPFQQIIADCNPQAPTHWLKKRCDRGDTVMLESRHEDNPRNYDGSDWTPAGLEYLAILDRLTGVRKARLRFGQWAAAEGMIYEGWDRQVHLVTLPSFEEETCPQGVPLSWPRYWSVDFGYRLGPTAAATHPFVWQAWAVNPKGRLVMYRELYRVEQLVEDNARRIKTLTEGEPKPQAIICDHDAEDRATLERHLGMSTIPARKSVKDGIDAVMSRLRVGEDGPGLVILGSAPVERDPRLDESGLPCSSIEEVEGYVWNDRTTKEQPRKESDHGMDAMRYMVAHLDLTGGPVTYGPSIWDA